MSQRKLKWLIAGVALLLVCAFVAQKLLARRADKAAAAA